MFTTKIKSNLEKNGWLFKNGNCPINSKIKKRFINNVKERIC